jgi:nucleotide-binding universal stress UspA family protein
MSCKAIVVVASGEAEDASVLSATAKLAARFAAHVRVVPAFPDPAAGLVYYGASLRRAPTDELSERVRASERETQERIESIARDAASRAGLDAASVVVEKRELQPAVALPPAAVLADLLTFGAAAARGPLAGLFAETLISTRAPCLLVRSAEWRFGAAAIAWDGSAQAGRAVRAAMPLLQAASRVIVLRNADDQGLEVGADPGRLIEYLARHGVANASARELRGERVAASLLAAARADQSELLVAGAYGRPRLYEMVLGGTTRALVNAPDAPHVLLAH